MMSAQLPTKVHVGGLVLLMIATAPAAGNSRVSTGMEADWPWEILGAGFLGALIVKLLDYVYHEIRMSSERRRTARRFVNENLDPVLNAADELVGKLRSLAVRDFKTLRRTHSSSERYHDFVDVLYLFAKLWANLEIFRDSGHTISVVRDKRGKTLMQFIDCMESRRMRIVRRSSQRAVAELALIQEDGRYNTIQFIDFVQRLEEDNQAKRWILPLTRVLDRMEHSATRQQLLRYGVVIHAMIDTLDPNHEVSRDRPSYPHKLSKKSWVDLKYRVFGVYLKFVENSKKYLGPPKRRP